MASLLVTAGTRGKTVSARSIVADSSSVVAFSNEKWLNGAGAVSAGPRLYFRLHGRRRGETMSQTWIECVPNFSEGRRAEVVDSLRRAIASVPGIVVLDVHSDADHNRSVVTFAGPEAAVPEAAFEAIRLAATLIDLDHHRGEHPRIGATDVVPFVPLAGATLEGCAALARQLGRRVGDELGIPVYLYEAAATRPERINLEALRRGEYEGLRDAITSDPARAPDFGPARLGPAGATVIGARPPLIAFNIFLNTSDVALARKIAHTIRASSGGLPCVKALGLEVDGLAQVSMNLTDFRRTSLPTVVEAVRREAEQLGVAILRSELVGLIPQQAMIDTAATTLHLEGFEPAQVLEVRLAEARTQASQEDFIERLAAPTATPGGGAAAAFAAAMASALVGMVAGLTRGKKKYAAVETKVGELAETADALRRELAAAVSRDSEAFEAVLRAMRLPKETDGEKTLRAEAIEMATRGAALVPLDVALAAARTGELAAELAELGNVNAISDAASAVALARAAFEAASLNVRINAQALSEPSARTEWVTALDAAARRLSEAESRAARAVRERAGLG
jgi:glutamate formiminotransferase/formiminotetrahydrofolate cyclodeaminase